MRPLLQTFLALAAIAVAGCAQPPTTVPTAPVSQVLSILNLELLNTIPFLCDADPDCEFFVTLIDGDYDINQIEALYEDFGKRIVPADCSSFEWPDDPREKLPFDEFIEQGGSSLYTLGYEPHYKVDTIVVDLKTVATKTASRDSGVVLGDEKEIMSLSFGRTTSQKRVITDQRKITFKPKKTSDMIDKYWKAYEIIYENDNNQKYPNLAPFYSEYLFTPTKLATEIICALQTYLAYDYVLAQSNLELVFAFQFVDTGTDKNNFKLKLKIFTVSGGTTNEAIDDRTHTITVKVKATESPDISDASSIVRALNAQWQRESNQGLNDYDLYWFTDAFVSNVSKAPARTAIQPYLWEAFRSAASNHVTNNQSELSDCAKLLGSWPFCLKGD